MAVQKFLVHGCDDCHGCLAVLVIVQAARTCLYIANIRARWWLLCGACQCQRCMAELSDVQGVLAVCRHSCHPDACSAC